MATKRGNVPTHSWQIRCFPYGERSGVPRLQQVEQKAVGRQRNLGLHSFLKIFGFNNNYIDHRLKLKLFDMLIRPICTYGSEIWISDFTLKDLH
jgi:hypothetical protein